MNRLANKVALITGAGRGIGAAIALAFAREGAAVVLAELDIETAQRTARDIEAACKASGAGSANGASAASAHAAGAKVLAVQTDVTQSASVQHAVREAEKAFGAVDIL
ncbi:MAG: SDR family NAD(P)-dependent oxidoreductase, partial [Paraburkholderia sp.]